MSSQINSIVHCMRNKLSDYDTGLIKQRIFFDRRSKYAIWRRYKVKVRENEKFLLKK